MIKIEKIEKLFKNSKQITKGNEKILTTKIKRLIVG